MTVRAPSLSGRRRVKVAMDGEVCRLELPLEFRVLEGRLALLVPEREPGNQMNEAPSSLERAG
jgi:diacylglycerol kinase family enzyme